jgi:hypothetical protein
LAVRHTAAVVVAVVVATADQDQADPVSLPLSEFLAVEPLHQLHLVPAASLPGCQE